MTLIAKFAVNILAFFAAVILSCALILAFALDLLFGYELRINFTSGVLGLLELLMKNGNIAEETPD